jgi:hypothetical protein
MASCEQHPSAKREQIKIKGGKRVMRTVFALKRENVGDGWSKLLNQGIGGFLRDKDG